MFDGSAIVAMFVTTNIISCEGGKNVHVLHVAVHAYVWHGEQKRTEKYRNESRFRSVRQSRRQGLFAFSLGEKLMYMVVDREPVSAGQMVVRSWHKSLANARTKAADHRFVVAGMPRSMRGKTVDCRVFYNLVSRGTWEIVP